MAKVTRPKEDIRTFIRVRIATRRKNKTRHSRNGRNLNLHFRIRTELDAAGSNEAAAHSEMSIITNPQSGQNFVSIDGKRTYLNLFDTSSTNAATAQITPTIVKNYPGTPAG